MEGKFVRAAYNNEGYVILGYQLANRSLGEEWMLLEVGITVRDRVPDYTLTRDALSLETPGRQDAAPAVHHGAAQGQHRARCRTGRRSSATQSTTFRRARAGRARCVLPRPDSRAMPRDDVELSSTRACLGRLYFHVPGGIAYGQHWLNVKFEKSLVRVPFRILTEEEEKFLSKNYKSISKQVEDAFKKKG